MGIVIIRKHWGEGRSKYSTEDGSVDGISCLGSTGDSSLSALSRSFVAAGEDGTVIDRAWRWGKCMLHTWERGVWPLGMEALASCREATGCRVKRQWAEVDRHRSRMGRRIADVRYTMFHSCNAVQIDVMIIRYPVQGYCPRCQPWTAPFKNEAMIRLSKSALTIYP